jgi:uncharacterized membrane protein YozB (DUF420 family)
MPPDATPPWYAFFPHLNAGLNALAFVLIVAGLVAVKRGRVTLHQNLMLAAFAVSAVFLACYLTYHISKAAPVQFEHAGWLRGVYLVILLSHIVLATVQVPLIVITIRLGLRAMPPAAPPGARARHKKWAQVTAPIWLYVSVTGVVVYLMLYRM